jgi:hypothetical protein
MQLDSWYDYYFENKGRCPECGRGLVMHVGCVGWICGKNKAVCSIENKTGKKKFKQMIVMFKKNLKYKNGRNLDIQAKKSYSKIDY